MNFLNLSSFATRVFCNQRCLSIFYNFWFIVYYFHTYFLFIQFQNSKTIQSNSISSNCTLIIFLIYHKYIIFFLTDYYNWYYMVDCFFYTCYIVCCQRRVSQRSGIHLWTIHKYRSLWSSISIWYELIIQNNFNNYIFINLSFLDLWLV